MGIGITFLIWALLGLAPACVAGLLFAGAAAYATRNVLKGRKLLVLCAGALPIAMLAWAGLVFGLQGYVNAKILRRDSGFGDARHCPLPNGYTLAMVDSQDEGLIYNTGKTTGMDTGASQGPLISVVGVQVAESHVLGRREEAPVRAARSSVSYFVLDTRTGWQERFSDFAALQARARELGIAPRLETVGAVYARYRSTWFEFAVTLLLLLPPILVALGLFRWTLRLRKSSAVTTAVPGRMRFAHSAASTTQVLS